MFQAVHGRLLKKITDLNSSVNAVMRYLPVLFRGQLHSRPLYIVELIFLRIKAGMKILEQMSLANTHELRIKSTKGRKWDMRFEPGEYVTLTGASITGIFFQLDFISISNSN